MRFLLTLILLYMLPVSASAGSITKASLKHQSTVTDKCPAGDGCATALGLSLSTSIEADITPAEAAGFSPNTLIQGSFPLGPTGAFRLSEDPNYQQGDTSVKINSTILFNNVAWKRSISLRWDNGKLKLKAKISAKQNVGNFSPDSDVTVKSQTKLASPGQVLVTLVADNLNDQFLDLQGGAATSVSTSDSAKPKKTGEVQLQSKVAVRGGF